MRDFDYDARFEPPAPAFAVEVGRSSADAHEVLLALIDTGADMTSFPPTVIQRLILPQVNEVLLELYEDGVKRQVTRRVLSAHVRLGVDLPAVNLQVFEFEWQTPADSVPEHIVLGRDVLNGLVLALHGPNLKGRLAVAS